MIASPAIDAKRQSAQRNRGSIFLEDGEILRLDAHPGDQFVQRIRVPRCATAAKAGNFVHVRCDESLPMRRPLSIMRAQDDWIEVLYKTLGDGLRKLSRQNPGDSVSVLGPIGVPFQPDPLRPRALLIGGGVGIPPMVFLADSLRDDSNFSPAAILGSEIPFPFSLTLSELAFAGTGADVRSTMPLFEQWGIPARLTSRSRFNGCFDGYVTDLARLHLDQSSTEQLAKTKIYGCGPTPMLKALAGLAAEYDVPCDVSLEEFMACAVGGCAGCTVPIDTGDGPAMKRVCVDGPVFAAETVVW